MNFVPGTHYVENLEVRFGVISPDTLRVILRDGRAASPLVFAHLRKRFENLTLASRDKADADCLEDDAGRIWQVRMLTNQGVKLLPSKSIGAGRTYDAYEYRKALSKISGFLVVDVTEMPKITFGTVLKGRLPEKTSFKYEEGLKLLMANDNQAARVLRERPVEETLALAV